METELSVLPQETPILSDREIKRLAALKFLALIEQDQFPDGRTNADDLFAELGINNNWPVKLEKSPQEAQDEYLQTH